MQLSPRLSKISWSFIEAFLLLGVFFLPFSKSAGEILLVSAAIFWLIRKFPFGESFPRVWYSGFFYAIFLAFCGVSLWAAPHPLLTTGLRGILKWAKAFTIFYVVFEYAHDTKKRRRLFYVFIFSLCLVSLDGFYQMWSGLDLIKRSIADMPGRFSRMSGPFGSPNDLAAFYLFGLPLAFTLWLDEKRWTVRSCLYLLTASFFLAGFIMTFSRGAFFALILGAALYLLLTDKRALIILSPLAVFIYFISSKMIQKNFFGSLSSSDPTILQRFEIWRVSWRMILAHPWIGNGVNLFYSKYPAFAPPTNHYSGYAHNCYLQICSEVGIFGLLAFLVPFIGILALSALKKRSGLKNKPLSGALFVAVVAFLGQSAVDTNFFALQTYLIFWIFWGVYCAEIL